LKEYEEYLKEEYGDDDFYDKEQIPSEQEYCDAFR
jgi:hypothetical protein